MLPISLPPLSLTRFYPTPFIRPLIIRCTDNWGGIVADGALHQPYGQRATALSVHDEGIVESGETFAPERLELLRDVFKLDSRSYSLSELEQAAVENGYSDAFGFFLRLIRGGSSLPVSHETFRPETNDHEV
jgi:hypothetical protein